MIKWQEEQQYSRQILKLGHSQNSLSQLQLQMSSQRLFLLASSKSHSLVAGCWISL